MWTHTSHVVLEFYIGLESDLNIYFCHLDSH